MVSMVRIAREDRNLTQEDDRVVEEMLQVLELETDIANVSASPSQQEMELWQKLKETGTHMRWMYPLLLNELVFNKKQLIEMDEINYTVLHVICMLKTWIDQHYG